MATPYKADTGRESRLQTYKRRYSRAYGISIQWWAQLQAAYHYCVPNRDLFYYTNQVQGAQKNAKVYDTTGIAAVRTFVSKIQNGLTPPQQTWCLLSAGSGIPEDQKEEINQILQQYTDTIFNYIRNSNFDLAINECYFDLAIATAALVVNEGPTDEKPLVFYSIPANQLAVEESINGFLESAYRTFGEIRMSEIPIMWPNAVLPSHMLKSIEMNPAATIKNLYEGVMYNHGRPNPFTIALWADDCLLLEEETESSPWVIFRWSRINTETNGRGPVLDALPSIISLQEVMRLELTASNMNICKPWMAWSDGVFNPWTFKMEPNTVIPIARTADGQPPLIPLPDVANPAFMQLTAMDLRQQINKLLFAEPLGPIDQSPTRTATELAIRQRSLAEEIGPAFTRLQQEFLSRLIQRIIYILKRRGLIEPLVINGHEIEIKYQSPLVIAQGQQDVDVFMNFYQRLQMIFGPETPITMINSPEMLHWLAEKTGIDLSLIVSKDDLREFLQAQSEQMQQMQAAGMMESMNAQQ